MAPICAGWMFGLAAVLEVPRESDLGCLSAVSAVSRLPLGCISAASRLHFASASSSLSRCRARSRRMSSRPSRRRLASCE